MDIHPLKGSSETILRELVEGKVKDWVANDLGKLPFPSLLHELLNYSPQNPTTMNSRELPKYKCHKEVWALQIKEVETTVDIPDGAQVKQAPLKCILHFTDPSYSPIEATSYVVKHKPQVGGYYIVYKDGYTSYSPKEAFEEGYSPI